MTALTVRALLSAACIVAASAAFLQVNTNTRAGAMLRPPAYRARSGPTTCNLDRKGRASGWHNTFSNKDSRHLQLLDIIQTLVNRQPPPTRGVASDGGGGGGGGGAPKMNSTVEENMAAEMNRALTRWYGAVGTLSLQESMATEMKLEHLLDILEELLDPFEEISRALARGHGGEAGTTSLEQRMATEMNRTMDSWYREQEWKHRA